VDTQYQTMTRPKVHLTARRLRNERKECGQLYRLIRARLGITQTAMGALIGCSRDSIVSREHSKKLYTIGELLTLKDLVGMGDVEWCELLREIAR
jgi:DNA-binding XRE family transcriptional regulator